ncbi:hypothetical protein PVAG01_04255 [Phlyctema vagabunda]|uniref:Secreted protein n=1 Tax=Phlyctema vagabunda TaxID=108571 RepID=A0ABR4PNU1_9HELO
MSCGLSITFMTIIVIHAMTSLLGDDNSTGEGRIEQGPPRSGSVVVVVKSLYDALQRHSTRHYTIGQSEDDQHAPDPSSKVLKDTKPSGPSASVTLAFLSPVCKAGAAR